MTVIGTGIFVYVRIDNAVSNSLGPPLSAAARAEIENADCARLARLDDRYAGGADSVEPDASGYRLVNERMRALKCPPHTTVQGS